VIERLHKELARAVQLPDIAARLALDGTEAVGSTPEQFAKFLAAERDQWGRVAKAANLRAE
jgi:tripartite-type tricarboxylate transporter receptor subunit TctC